ncbi:CBS domain-containing protein [Micromonospora sp. NPDC093277]|uniref:CBS domain-containing protein n=1 Tax=Micromonospora sp. NPDC093277 TaxID=3364291 RepID=UPI0038250838
MTLAKSGWPMPCGWGSLRQATRGVCGVRVGDTLERATTLMLKHNYSQLAVFDKSGHLHGAVSWESICKAQLARSRADLAGAVHAPAAVGDRCRGRRRTVDSTRRRRPRSDRRTCDPSRPS